ncbi:MAG: putative zinc-binding metallopeptidase [Halieaceae bacterium]|nr:putative zinc-binding metallopeptidase [Halieaceae bacterium]
MIPYQCQCGQPLFCENTRCGACGRDTAFEPLTNTMLSLDRNGEDWVDVNGRTYRPCANRREYNACNGVVDRYDENSLCSGCRLNRTIPMINRSENLLRWKRLEAAKRRMIAGVSKLGLNVNTGMRFDFLEDRRSHPEVQEHFVATGHKDGVITVNVLEADELELVKQREMMGERYRTVLGHLRHEAGHFFYPALIGNVDAFRARFGDPFADYGAALSRYYEAGPPENWQALYISRYASSHPLEDWAECFAHLLHIEDTLETAVSYGFVDEPGKDTRDKLQTWARFAVPLNELSRSLGQRDPYPFILTETVIQKLQFVADAITAYRDNTAAA